MADEDSTSGVGGITKLIAAVATLVTALAGIMGFIVKPKAEATEYSGAISFTGGTPVKEAQLDLVGTPCTTRTTETGYFRFASCPQASHLTQARIRVYLPTQDQPCLAALRPSPNASDIQLDPNGCGTSVKSVPVLATPPPTPAPSPDAERRYIQLGSTQTQQQGADLAQKQADSIQTQVCVYASRGLFATAVGPLPVAEAESRLGEYKTHSNIPSSAYLVLGKTYVSVGQCSKP